MSEVVDRFEAVATGHEIIVPDDPNKNPQIKVTLAVTSGPRAGRSIEKYLSLHPNAADITAKQLRAMGWTCNDVTVLEGLGSVRCQVTEKSEEYNGKVRPDYSIWALQARAALKADDKKKFADRFKAMAMKSAEFVVQANDANKAPDTLPQPSPVESSGASDTPF